MHPLQQKVAAARRLAKRLLLLHGLFRLLSLVAPVVLLLAALDYWLRLEDRGLRIVWSLAAVGAAAWAARRFLWPAWRQKLNDVAVAQRVEQHLTNGKTGPTGDLSSAIEFLGERVDDPLAGSAALRRAVVAATEAKFAGANWNDAIDRRPTLRAAAWAALVFAVALVIGLWNPADARLALARLANPLGDAAWPPANDLAFKTVVDRVALGQPFEVELIDRNRNLPNEAEIEYRYNDDSGQQIEREKMQPIGDVMVARKEKVSRPFDYRAQAGDDRKMAWIHVEVVEPPTIKELRIALHPPAYTGWPASTSERRIVALRGTTVDFSAVTNRPLTAATYHQSNGLDLAADISADGLTFSIGGSLTPMRALTKSQPPTKPVLTIDKSGPYWFELRDREGMVAGAGDRWDIQAIVDRAPSVSLEQPVGNLFVTPGASVPIAASVKEDLAIRSVALRYSRSDRTQDGDVEISLFEGPDRAAESPAPTAVKPAQWTTQSVTYNWDLAPLGLPPGASVVLSVAASDYAPQTGVSTPRRLTIVTPEELEDRLAQRQSLIFNELQRILKMQQTTRDQTRGIEAQLDRAGRFERGEVDRLRGVDVNQRQVRRSLVSPGEGLRPQIVSLLSELTSNRVSNSQMHRRLQGLADEIARLDREELAHVERDLTMALKLNGESSPAAPSSIRQSLTGVDHFQEAIAAALEKMLGDFNQWNSLRGVTHDLVELRRDQAEQQKNIKELAPQTLTKDPRDLSPAQQAELARLANRQADLSRRFEKLLQHMDQVAGQLKPTDPNSADSLADAAHSARGSGLSGLMRDGAAHVGQNQMGQALAEQTAIGRGLDELLDILSNRREQELSRLVQKLRDSEQELSDLRKEQTGLRKKLKDADQANDPAERREELQRLSRRQQDLREQTDRLARQLQRLQAQKAASSLIRAAGQMNDASRASAAGDGASSHSASDGAAKDLDEVQQEVAQARRKAESDLALEQLARLEDALQALVDRQAHAQEETARLDKLRHETGSLTRSQSQSVLDLARTEQTLAGEVEQVAAKLSGTEAFQFVLQSAAAGMNRVAERLKSRDTGEKTQQLEQDIIARLRQLVAAMKDSPKAAGESPANDPAGGDGGQQQTGPARSMAEIRLVRLAQEDLNRRTQRLSEATGGGNEPNLEQQQELADLAAEQGRLAEVIGNLGGDRRSGGKQEHGNSGDEQKGNGKP